MPNIDGNGIIEQAIGAFFGFVLALLGAWITTIVAKRIKIYRLRKRVHLELAETYLKITAVDDKGELLKKDMLMYYDCPIWDSVIAAAILLDIGSNAFVKSLSEIYGRLKMLQEMELQMILVDESQDPDVNILNKRKILATTIEKSDHIKPIRKIINKLNKKTN